MARRLFAQRNFASSKRKQNPFVFQFLEACCGEAVESRGPLAAPAVFGRGFQDLEQLNLSPKISLVEFLVEDGLINALQFSQAELLRK